MLLLSTTAVAAAAGVLAAGPSSPCAEAMSSLLTDSKDIVDTLDVVDKSIFTTQKIIFFQRWKRALLKVDVTPSYYTRLYPKLAIH